MERLRGTCISIHASAREATRGATFQADHKIISIHASAREATKPKSTGLFTYIISIHASAREATLSYIFCTTAARNFNPRLREGGDAIRSPDKRPWFISIHVSAREATSRVIFRVILALFQSTPPWGRRPYFLCALRYIIGISIHASAREATGRSWAGASWPMISIHAFAMEATSML